MTIETAQFATLVASICAPWRASVAECLSRWQSLDGASRATSYLVLEGKAPGLRHTLNSSAIEQLAAKVGVTC